TTTTLARTTSQRHADALVEMATHSAPMPPGAKEARILLSVLMGEGTFRNLCEVELTRRPIPPGAVREWLDDTLFERIVFDGPDRVLGVSHRRDFTGALRRAIEVRDRTCTWPGCDVPAVRCHGDHANPVTAGGPTAQANGQCLCATHNGHKGTNPEPRRRADPDGHLRWLDDDP
ncbi:MAG: HNH endonuclease signature motif containing protein, partial [Acidimicrobiales bacterium]